MGEREPQVGAYYAKDGVVWKRPVRTRSDDRTTTISIGFPVCAMRSEVGPETAEAVAELMNRGDLVPELAEALKRAAQFIRNGVELGYIRMPDPDVPDPAHDTPGILEAAIAKAEGRPSPTRSSEGARP